MRKRVKLEPNKYDRQEQELDRIAATPYCSSPWAP